MAFTWILQEDETVGLGFKMDTNAKNSLYRAPAELTVAKLSQMEKNQKKMLLLGTISSNIL